jgi:hypothetical protein
LSTLEFAGLLYESSIPDRSSSIPDCWLSYKAGNMEWK